MRREWAKIAKKIREIAEIKKVGGMGERTAGKMIAEKEEEGGRRADSGGVSKSIVKKLRENAAETRKKGGRKKSA